MIPIVPAFIPQTEAEVQTILETLRFSHEVHLDVVDGLFVADTSWPYQPAGQPAAVKQYTDEFSLEVDLMVVDPLHAAVDWVTAGADRLVFHVETISLDNFKNFEAFTHISVGISAHGATPLSQLLEYAEFADYIQLMGIHEIGSQGQPFDQAVLEKIALVRAAYPEKSITIDGSVNEHTITKLKLAGADRFVVGSAITQQPDAAAAHKALSLLIN